MRNIMLSALAAFLISLLGFGDAEAQSRGPVTAEPLPAPRSAAIDCRGQPTAACDAARRAVDQGSYRGPVAPTTVPMACVRVVIQRPANGLDLTEVVWTKGTSIRNGGTYLRDGMVIARQRPGAQNIRFYPDRTDLVVVESCIPQAWLQDVETMTLCNGTTPGQGFHWQVHVDTLAKLKGRPGHPETFLPLLPPAVTNTITPAQAKADYGRYMSGAGARVN